MFAVQNCIIFAIKLVKLLRLKNLLKLKRQQQKKQLQKHLSKMIHGRGKNCFIALLGIVVSLFLSSCTKQSIKSNADEDQETEKSALLERVIQQEAMLVNV